MKILNVMFSKKKGGLEQAFLDYTSALKMQGHQVISVIHPKAIVKENLHDNYVTIHNFNRLDILAVRRLTKLIMAENPHCIVTHGARASYLLRKTNTNVPLIAVSHNNTRFEYLFGSDAIIAITEQMRLGMVKAGQDPKQLFTVPNMIHIPDGLSYREPKPKDVPVIGTCARFVSIKGIDIFLLSLAELKRRNISFKAKIAGEGPEKANYNKIIKHHGLENHVEFVGWVTDKKIFYESLDIFCLPSRDEAFGLVVLEGLMHSLPSVLTKTAGPLEIVGDTNCALLVPPSDEISLAEGFIKIIYNNELASQLAHAAFERVQYYSSLNISRLIQRVIEEVCYKKLNDKY